MSCLVAVFLLAIDTPGQSVSADTILSSCQKTLEAFNRRHTKFEVQGSTQNPDKAGESTMFFSHVGEVYVHGALHAYGVDETYTPATAQGRPTGLSRNVSRTNVDDGEILYQLDLSTDSAGDRVLFLSRSQEHRINSRSHVPDVILDGVMWGDMESIPEEFSKGAPFLLQEQASIAGSQCYGIRNITNAKEETVWFDPSRGFLPVKGTKKATEGGTTWRYEFEVWEFNKQGENWVPASYTYALEVLNPDGSAASITDGHVRLESVEIEAEFDDGQVFRPHFPDGIDVINLQMENRIGELKWNDGRGAAVAILAPGLVDELENEARRLATVPTPAVLESSVPQGSEPENSLGEISRIQRRFYIILAIVVLATVFGSVMFLLIVRSRLKQNRHE